MTGQGDMGLAQRSVRKLTHDDYLQLPDDGRRHQIIDGVHHVSPSPTLQHQRIVGRLFADISAYIAGQVPAPGEVLCAPLDVILSLHDVVQPDLLYVSRERFHILGDWVHGAPDLVVEVLSRSTRGIDAGVKFDAYERTGVAECWLVDPERPAVVMYRRDAAGQLSIASEAAGAGGRVSSPLLPGLTIDLARCSDDAAGRRSHHFRGN